MAKRGLSLGKVASYCGVTRKTILRWVQDGLIESFSLPSGHNRVLPEQVVAFLQKNNMPVPPELLQSGEKRSVLICEDDPQIRRAIVDLLSKQFHVVEASDGIEACIRLGESRPDLITIDIRMPRMDGLALCRHIRQDPKLQGISIVVISAHIDNALQTELEPLVNAVINKPFSPAELLQTCITLAQKQEIPWAT